MPCLGLARYSDVTNSGHISRPCESSVKQRSTPSSISHVAPRRSTTSLGSHVTLGISIGGRGVFVLDGVAVSVEMSGGHGS